MEFFGTQSICGIAQNSMSNFQERIFRDHWTNLWVRSPNKRVFVISFIIRASQLFGANHFWKLLLLSLLDVLFVHRVLRIKSQIYSPANREGLGWIFTFIYVKFLWPVLIILYQFLHGPGGIVVVISAWYIFISCVILSVRSSADSYFFHPLLILSTCGSVYYWGEFNLEYVFRVGVSLTTIYLLLISLIWKMREFVAHTVEEENTRTHNATKQRMFAVASHELRNPLQALTFLVGYLENSVVDPREKEIVTDIQDSIHNLHSIVENVLDYAKIDADKAVKMENSLKLLDLVESIASVHFQSAERKGIKICTYIDPEIPTELLGDSMKILQMMSNLTLNAIKRTPHGIILLQAHLQDISASMCKIVLQCCDGGIGLSKSQISELINDEPPEAIEDEFPLLEHSSSSLELFVAKSLAKILDAKISLDSEHERDIQTQITITMSLKMESRRTIKDNLIQLNYRRAYFVHHHIVVGDYISLYLHEMGIVKTFVRNSLNDSIEADSRDTVLLIHQELINANRRYFWKFARIIVVGVEFGQYFHEPSITEPIRLERLNRKLAEKFNDRDSIMSLMSAFKTK